MRSNQNLRVFWKSVNLQGRVWENLYRIIMKTMLQKKRKQFTTALKFGSQVHSYASSHEGQTLKKIPAWDLTKVRSQKEVIDEARTKSAKVHFASLMDICYLKNAELEAKHQKYKCRVVLRGDIGKDDSGSYAVFTEQGSSASQVTAAKVMDIISRLPGCARQAADAVSADTQEKNGRCSKITGNSQIGISRHLDSSTTTQKAKIMVQDGRPSRSS